MSDVYQPDHVGEAEGELLSQFRKPRILGFVRGIAQVIQNLEDTVLALRVERLLDNAVGAQLDQYGRLVGEPRGDLEDDDYRRFIRVRIQTNLCQGTVNEFLVILRTIAGPTVAPTRYRLLYPASYSLTVTRATWLSSSMRTRVRAQMRSIKPAGRALELVEAPDGAFRFGVGPGFGLGTLARVL